MLVMVDGVIVLTAILLVLVDVAAALVLLLLFEFDELVLLALLGLLVGLLVELVPTVGAFVLISGFSAKINIVF